MHKRLPLTCALMFMVALITANAQVASPPLSERDESPVVQPRTMAPANAVTAILVKSWGQNPVWNDLNTNWSAYGTIPVSIDQSTLINSDFTYQDLVNTNANVIILSDPAGKAQQYSLQEVEALAKYAKAGHPILATYLTFQYMGTDNRALAPIFGLSSTLTYDVVGISNEFTKVANACLFNRIPGSSGMSNGYPYSQVPSGASWIGNLGTASVAAESDNYNAIISGYHKDSGTAIYISNMPEYNTIGGDDEQLLYNAITCYVAKK